MRNQKCKLTMAQLPMSMRKVRPDLMDEILASNFGDIIIDLVASPTTPLIIIVQTELQY